jgi:beta-glucanase (GH16 family)
LAANRLLRPIPAALLTLSLLSFPCALTSNSPQTQAPPGWELIWSDEFNAGDGSGPDATKWTYDLGGAGWGNHELETYTNRPDNVQIRGGHLVITARKESFTGTDGIARKYTSARLKTQRLFAQRYGRFEARIKIPAGEGMWPAFWMLGDDIETVHWPQCGEIDIMENIGKEKDAVHGSLHGPNPAATTADQTSTFQLPTGQNFSDDFHVFAVEWDDTSIKFFVDANNYATMTKEQWPQGSPWVFDHPFFIILNLAVGGDWPGPPDASTQFPGEMLVDYVRVYQKTPGK